MLLSSRRAVGIDLGATGIRAVEVSLRGQGPEVIRAAEVELPPGALDHGAVRDPAVVSKAIRRLWRRGRFSTRRAVFGVPAVLTRQMDLPWMEPEDFRSALRYQVQDALPVDVRTVELDYSLLETRGATPSGTPETSRILLVATATEAVRDTAKALRKGGVRPIAADASAFALLRTALNADPDPRPAMLVDLGADHLTVVIHAGGTPLLIRSVGTVGGRAATTALQEALGMTEEAAELRKMTVGLKAPAPVLTPIAESSVFTGLPSADRSERDLDNERVVAELGRWATTVVKEIQDSLDYLDTSGVGTQVARITLTGRVSAMPGLAERIETQVRKPVDILAPFAGLSLAPRVQRHLPPDGRYTCALGLALP
ncbi:MAG: type pilus assembly protein PilM [Actinomycetota bacterium]|jgi:type IV pilus assembly protein PilM